MSGVFLYLATLAITGVLVYLFVPNTKAKKGQ